MKCGRAGCKICKKGLDVTVEELYSKGYGYRRIARYLGWKVSHMTVKRHLSALKANSSNLAEVCEHA